MSTLIEDSPAVAVDHDTHITQLDFVDKISGADHAGIPVVHVTEPTSPLPQSTSPEPAVLSRSSTVNRSAEETYQQRSVRPRSAVEVCQTFFSNLGLLYST